jgi:hypothetical protein
MDLTQPEIQSETCSLCGELPDKLTVNTGREGEFPAAFHKLIPVDTQFTGQGQFSQFRSCPDCNAYFVWEEYPQMYGSGNNAEECLTRFSAKASLLLNNLFASEPKALLDPADVGEYFEAITLYLLLEMLQSRVSEAPDIVTPFVPKLVRLLGKFGDSWVNHPLTSLLKNYAAGSLKQAADVEAAQAQYAFSILEKHFARAGAVVKHSSAPTDWSHFCLLFYLNANEVLENEMRHAELLIGLLAELVDFIQAFSGERFTKNLYDVLYDFHHRNWLEPYLPESARLKIWVMEEMKSEDDDYDEQIRLGQMYY